MEMFPTQFYEEAASYIASQIKEVPQIAVILGSGLGSLADEIENPLVIPYTTIPHFVKSTATGHKGNLIFGTISGKKVIAMQGRFHYYEGYEMQQVIKMVEQIAEELHIPLKKGVYVALTGPSYETPSEYAFWGKVGGDAIGMSTVPEVIVARHAGIRVFGMSVITNEGYHFADDFVNNGDDVVREANKAAVKMGAIFRSLIGKI